MNIEPFETQWLELVAAMEATAEEMCAARQRSSERRRQRDKRSPGEPTFTGLPPWAVGYEGNQIPWDPSLHNIPGYEPPKPK